MVRPAVHGSGRETSRGLDPGAPSPVETGSAEPAPTEAVPTDPVRTDPAPSEPAATQAPAVDPGRQAGASTPTAASGPATGTESAEASSPGMPRWLLLLAGAAAATVAIAGVRAVAWLVAPLLLALVVVVGLWPVSSWLRRHGAPRWVATTVLLVLV